MSVSMRRSMTVREPPVRMCAIGHTELQHPRCERLVACQRSLDAFASPQRGSPAKHVRSSANLHGCLLLTAASNNHNTAPSNYPDSEFAGTCTSLSLQKRALFGKRAHLHSSYKTFFSRLSPCTFAQPATLNGVTSGIANCTECHLDYAARGPD
jgi:hypothetical protein